MASSATDRFAKVPLWWIGHPDVNNNRLSVLTALMRFADKDSLTCYPSQKTLADILGVSRALVNKIIKELVEFGLILKTYRRRGDNGMSSCLYKILVNEPKSAGKVEKPAPISSDQGVTGAVKNNDTNNTKINYTLCASQNVSIKDWSPSAEVCAEIERTVPGFDVEQYAKKFRAKVEAKGYTYPDLDQAFSMWFKQDHARGLFNTKPQKRKAGVAPTAERAPIVPVDVISTAATTPPEVREEVVSIVTGTAGSEVSDKARFAAGMILLGRELGQSFYDQWLKNLHLVDLSDGRLRMKGRSPFAVNFLAEKHDRSIISACASVGLHCDRVTG